MPPPRPQRLPRGIRNNNPGNIRRGIDWNGLSAEQTDPEFAQFDEAVMGIRAMARILLTYQRKHKLKTIREMISRWAPPSENDTDAYVAHVAAESGVDADLAVDLASNRFVFRRIVETIIRHENGRQPYLAETIEDGIKRALA